MLKVLPAAVPPGSAWNPSLDAEPAVMLNEELTSLVTQELDAVSV